MRLEFVGDVAHPHAGEGGSCRESGRGVPALHLVESGFEVLEAVSVEVPRYFEAFPFPVFQADDGTVRSVFRIHVVGEMDHAIWTLQGRHRDMAHFTEVHYTRPGGRALAPSIKDGKWEYSALAIRRIDKDRFEEFKTRFYELQGWDTASGFPTRGTLAGMGLGYVADELEAQGKLGA